MPQTQKRARKTKKKSAMKCWKGYERVPGTKAGAKGSCRKKRSSR